MAIYSAIEETDRILAEIIGKFGFTFDWNSLISLKLPPEHVYVWGSRQIVSVCKAYNIYIYT